MFPSNKMTPLSESSQKAHLYLCIAAFLLLLVFMCYVYICEHRRYISKNELWSKTFLESGLNKETINHLSHDDDTWYYKDKSTCVGYGNEEEPCKRHESVCTGGKYYGTAKEQAHAIVLALNNGGEHALCPLIYEGTD